MTKDPFQGMAAFSSVLSPLPSFLLPPEQSLLTYWMGELTRLLGNIQSRTSLCFLALSSEPSSTSPNPIRSLLVTLSYCNAPWFKAQRSAFWSRSFPHLDSFAHCSVSSIALVSILCWDVANAFVQLGLCRPTPGVHKANPARALRTLWAICPSCLSWWEFLLLIVEWRMLS